MQARQIFRFAKKHHFILTRGGVATLQMRESYPDMQHACALAVAASMLGCWGHTCLKDGGYDRTKTKLTPRDFEALEAGFEGYPHLAYLSNNRYYKVGQNVAKLAGLTPR